MKVWIIILLSSLFTMLFRILGNFIPIPRNKFFDKFLEAIPISVLVVLFFPDIFIAIGNTYKDILIAIIAMIVIAIMTLKQIDLGKIMVFSIFIAIFLKWIF